MEYPNCDDCGGRLMTAVPLITAAAHRCLACVRKRRAAESVLPADVLAKLTPEQRAALPQ